MSARARRVVTPAWLAKRVGPFGHQVALGMTALGLLLLDHHGQEGAEEFFDEMARDWEPGRTYLDTWRDLEGEYPHLRGRLGVFYDWAVGAPGPSLMKLTDVALCLRDIDFEASAAGDQLLSDPTGDLLGELHNEIVRMGERSRVAFQLLGIRQNIVYLEKFSSVGVLENGQSFLDTSCATGLRAVAMAEYMRANGNDPATASWFLADHDPLALGIAAVNAVSYGLGENLHLEVAPYPARPFDLWPTEGHFDRWVTDTVEAIQRVTHGAIKSAMARAIPSFLRNTKQERDNTAKWHGITTDERRIVPADIERMTIEDAQTPQAVRSKYAQEVVNRFIQYGADPVWAWAQVSYKLMEEEYGRHLTEIVFGMLREGMDSDEALEVTKRPPRVEPCLYQVLPEMFRWDDIEDAAFQRKARQVRDMQRIQMLALPDIAELIDALRKLTGQMEELKVTTAEEWNANLDRLEGIDAAAADKAEPPKPPKRKRKSKAK